MRHILLLIVISAMFVSCTVVPRTTFLTIPEVPPKVDPIDVAAYEEEYGEYDGIYLFYEYHMEHSARTSGITEKVEWSYTRVHRSKHVVLNPEADWLTTFNYRGTPDKLYLIVTSPDGIASRFGIQDLLEERDSRGYVVQKFAFPDIRKGSVIEIGYEVSGNVRYNPGLSQDMPLQFEIPCQNLKVSYCYPEWWQVEVKKPGKMRDVGYSIIELPRIKKKKLSYEGINIPAVTDEPFSPYFKEVANYLQFMVTGTSKYEWEKITPESWDELTESLRRQFFGKNHVRSDIADAFVDSLILKRRTAPAIAREIVEWIRSNIKVAYENYDGNLKKIVRNGKGDILDHCILAKSMLKRAGFRSNIVLTHSAREGYFDPKYISIDQLSVPAVRVSLDGEYYYLFPYVDNLPFNHTPEWFQGQVAIILDEAVKPVRIPEGNRADNTMDESYNLTISEDGTIKVEETKTVRGATAFYTRKALKNLRDEELRDAVSLLLTYTDGDVNLQAYHIANLDAYNEPLIVSLSYSIDNLVTVMPEEVLFQTGGLFSPISNQKLKLEPERRKNPIKIYNNTQYNKNITINFPSNWTVETDFQGIQDSNFFGSIEGSYQTVVNNLLIDQTLKLNRCLKPKEQFPKLLDLIGDGSRLNIPSIVFSVDNNTL